MPVPAIPPTPMQSAALPGADDPSRFDPIIVEVEADDGSMREARWLGPAFEIASPINGLPTCTLPVRCDKGLLVDRNDGIDDDNPDYQPIETMLRDDRLVQVRTARGEPSADMILFRGYLQAIVRAQTARGPRASVKLINEAQVLAEKPELFVQGQLWVRKSQYAEWLAAPTTTRTIRPEIVSGLPCIFNPDGAKNCHKTLVSFDDELNIWPNQPTFWRLPVFTHRLDPLRQHWTWARVFMHLLFRWRRTTGSSAGNLGQWPQMFTRGNVIRDKNLWAAIALAGLDLIDPADLAGTGPSGDPLLRVLLGVPQSHSTEGMDALSALKWSCAKSGLGFAIDTQYDTTQQEFRSAVRFFAPGWTVASDSQAPGNVIGTLKLASPDFVTFDKNWQTEVRPHNNVTHFEITSDASAARNRFAIIGAAYQYEMTVELVPGWRYDAGRAAQIDFDPGNTAGITTAVAGLTAGSAFSRAYDRTPDGTLQLLGDNSIVLRRWILPEFEDLSTTHTRPWGYWNAAKFQLFDWRSVRMGEIYDDTIANGGRLAVRPRPAKQCLTDRIGDHDTTRILAPSGTPFPPLLQFSTDSGATWLYLPSAADVLRQRCGVVINTPTLYELRGANGFTLAEAYFRGALRMRLTCTIEGDRAAQSGWIISAGTASRRARGIMLCKPGEVRRALRDDRDLDLPPAAPLFEAGNSIFRDQGNQQWPDGRHPANESIELGAVRSMANLLKRLDRVRHSGTAELIGIVAATYAANGTYGSGYRPGDEISMIEAQAGNAEVRKHDLALVTQGTEIAGAIIAAVNWTYDPGDGVERGPAARTMLTLEDPAALMSFGK